MLFKIVYTDICNRTNITLEDVLDTIIIKNKKWREKFQLYTRNKKFEYVDGKKYRISGRQPVGIDYSIPITVICEYKNTF